MHLQMAAANGACRSRRSRSQTSVPESRCPLRQTGVPNFHLSVPAPTSRRRLGPPALSSLRKPIKNAHIGNGSFFFFFTGARCGIIYHGTWCPTDRPNFLHQWDRGTGVRGKEHYCVLTLRKCLGGCCHIL